MKRYIKTMFLVGLSSLTLVPTSCIDEVEPTDVASEEAIGRSALATEGLLMGMPMYLNAADDDYHFQFGYGCMIHMRDVMTGDQTVTYSGYDWFSPWASASGMGKTYARPSYVYNYYYKLAQTANGLIAAVDTTTATDPAKGNWACASAFRAMTYLDIARMYEFLPNDKIASVNADGNDVAGLTAPIVTEKTTQEEARNNPRATHQEMFDFILNDLDNAEKYIELMENSSKTLPHLDAVYGLKARLYLWNGDYEEAEKYAHLAIAATKTKPMTRAQSLSTTAGFNDISLWMWGSQMTSEDDAVKTGIINWTSWMSNETTFGYASAGPFVSIDRALYDRISDTDWRKLLWKAPEGHPLFGQNPWLVDEGTAASFPDYASLKFRPNEGNMEDYKTGAASAFPLMRVEEMYFIEAEAAAHQDAARGAELLNAFMKANRDAAYSCPATSTEGVVDEVILQKRIELWGEGHTFFDIKRLNISVTRAYKGTNVTDDNQLMNTNGRPAWMNFVISQSEEDNNNGVIGYNNPDPTGAYTPIARETL